MLTDVPGIRVGHWTDRRGLTGCTVVLAPEGTVGSCQWRAGSPADREWVILSPENRVDRVHAVVLSGGSAFGLASADGVMNWLAERGIGWDAVIPGIKVPIVPGAILFDLGIGDPRARPGPAEGRAACDAAVATEFEIGCVGAGAISLGSSTVIGVVATSASLSKQEAYLVASLGRREPLVGAFDTRST